MKLPSSIDLSRETGPARSQWLLRDLVNPSSALCPLAQRATSAQSLVSSLAPGTIGREVLGAGAMDRIHAENVARLAALNPFEVERERRELLSQLEPQLVAFLRARRMRTEHTAAPAAGDERDTSAKKPKQEPSAAAAAARRTSDSLRVRVRVEIRRPGPKRLLRSMTTARPAPLHRSQCCRGLWAKLTPCPCLSLPPPPQLLSSRRDRASATGASRSSGAAASGLPVPVARAAELAKAAQARNWLHMGRLEAEKLRWTGTGAADDGGGDDARAAASAPTPTRELRARFDLRGLALAPPTQEQREADARSSTTRRSRR